MSGTMEYKNYIGSVEFSQNDGVFYGRVLGIRSLLSYEGTTARELAEDFHGVVDEYLAYCGEQGISPEQAKVSRAPGGPRAEVRRAAGG